MRLIFVIILLNLLLVLPAAAQEPATPIPVNPPTQTPTDPPATELPTTTPTSAGPAQLEALTAGTNVRGQPDINSERVGQINPGTRYTVVAKRFNWYQIAFPEAPGGSGWVYYEVVTLIGDANAIPELSLEQVPTENPMVVSGRETLAAITATPGAIATMTAFALITPTGMFSVPQAGGPQAVGGAALPTFTFPPFTDTPINIQALTGQTDVQVEQRPVPPIAPIAGLIGVGLLGLTISLLRRV